MALSRFETAIAPTGCHPGPESGQHGGTVDVDLQPEWNVDGRILNGGYLNAVIVRACREIAGTHTAPVAVSTGFVAPPEPGSAQVSVTVLRRGSRIVSTTATLTQRDRTIATSLVTLAADSAEGRGGAPVPAQSEFAGSGLAGQDPAGPELAGPDPASPELGMPTTSPPGDAIRVDPDRLPGPPGIARLIDFGFVADTAGWLRGDYRAGAHLQCWMSFADGGPIDETSVCALVDMAPPVAFALGRFGWAPTLQLQVGIFARPVSGPVLLDLAGRPYDGTVVAEDGTLWDAAGTLVARSRQIALAPRV